MIDFDADALRDAAVREPLDLTAVLELLNSLSEMRNEVEEVVDADVDDPLNDLVEIVERLQMLRTKFGVGVDTDTLDTLRSAIEDLQNDLPDTDALQTLVENYDEALEAVEQCIDFAETPSVLRPPGMAEAHEQAAQALNALADALVEASNLTPVNGKMNP